jgi:hypothetical protein
MITSTPCEYIRTIAEEYGIPLIVNEGQGGIARDWNFAVQQCGATYITIAHQDDIYEPNYAKIVVTQLENRKKPLIAFTDYGELRDGERIISSPLIKVKKVLLIPLKVKALQKSVFIRRRVLSLGNAICCPSVTYCTENIEKPFFKEGLGSNLDWETWERLSRRKGEFVYVPQVLMYHRLHQESTTSRLIGENKRGQEDYEIFCKFWPKWVARGITRVYGKGEKYNG